MAQKDIRTRELVNYKLESLVKDSFNRARSLCIYSFLQEYSYKENGKNSIVESIANGQHILSQHVDKTDSELFQRLADQKWVSVASTFTEDIAASNVVNSVLPDADKVKKVI